MVTIIEKEGEEVGAEIIAQSIVAIAEAMRKINATRLKQDTLITLIHAHSKVAKRDITLVLNNLTEIENIWLKKKPVKA